MSEAFRSASEDRPNQHDYHQKLSRRLCVISLSIFQVDVELNPKLLSVVSYQHELWQTNREHRYCSSLKNIL